MGFWKCTVGLKLAPAALRYASRTLPLFQSPEQLTVIDVAAGTSYIIWL